MLELTLAELAHENRAAPVRVSYTPTPRQPDVGFFVRVDPEIEFLDTPPPPP